MLLEHLYKDHASMFTAPAAPVLWQTLGGCVSQPAQHRITSCAGSVSLPAATTLLQAGWSWTDRPESVSPLQTFPRQASSARDPPAEPEASSSSSHFSLLSPLSCPGAVVPPSADTFQSRRLLLPSLPSFLPSFFLSLSLFLTFFSLFLFSSQP